jgi:hypothetical protein
VGTLKESHSKHKSYISFGEKHLRFNSDLLLVVGIEKTRFLLLIKKVLYYEFV